MANLSDEIKLTVRVSIRRKLINTLGWVGIDDSQQQQRNGGICVFKIQQKKQENKFQYWLIWLIDRWDSIGYYLKLIDRLNDGFVAMNDYGL